MILATAGHVDHGKTSLIRRLTGVDTDRLAEERRRGLTIELGYAFLQRRERRIGFIDVPGHLRFVHTMVAGAHGLDGALLIVAADDGPMPQTLEHLDILRLLGTPTVVPVITKIDRVGPDRVVEVSQAVEALLAGSGLAATPCRPVCAPQGEGIDALLATIDGLPAREAAADAPFRLSVDRIIRLKGTGLVLAGTVAEGSVARGSVIAHLPGGTALRVRDLRVHDHPADLAGPGDRCALNVTGIDADAVHRGDWLCPVGPDERALDTTTTRVDVLVTPLPGARLPSREGTVHVHIQAARRDARLRWLERDASADAPTRLARLTLTAPALLAHGDRLVLRDAAGRHTTAGARVLDVLPPARGGSRPARLGALQALAEGLQTSAPDRLAVALDVIDGIEAAGCVPADWPRRNLRDFTASAPAGWCTGSAGGVSLLVRETRLTPLLEDLPGRVREWHSRQPQAPGIPVATLRRVVAADPRLFALALGRLLADGRLERRGETLCEPGFQPRLQGEDARAWKRLETLLQDGGQKPPVLHHLAQALALPPDKLRTLLKRLAALGYVVQIADNRVMLPEAVDALARTFAQVAAARGEAGVTAAEFRDASGVGRNLAIDVLEYFDATGQTYRRGDARFVSKLRGDGFGR